MRNQDCRTPDHASDTRSASDLFAAVFASAPDAAIVVDRSGIVRGWNRAAHRRYGWTGSEMVGRSFDSMLSEPHGVRFRTALNEAVRGEDVEPFDLTWVGSDAREFSSQVRVSAVVGDDGDVIGASVVACDDRHDPAADAADRAASERFRHLFAANVFGICYGEGDLVVESNDAFLEAIGAEDSDLRDGISIGAILVGDIPTAESFADGVVREFEIRRLDGVPAHLLAAGVRLSSPAAWLGVALDLTERKAAERAIAHLALHDPITGLPNRRLLIDRVQQALSRSTRQDRIVAVLFCDVDHFKHVNDRHGHRAGDIVLQSVARRLESVLREDDTVARVGGDEFVIVLGTLSDPTEATQVAERARIAVHEPIPLDDTDIRVTISIGVSLSAGPLERVEALLTRADATMYIAKQQGRDRVAFTSDELSTSRYHESPTDD